MSVSRELKVKQDSYFSSYASLINFILVALAVLTISRVFLAWLHWDRVGTSALIPLFVGGLRIDLCLIGMFSVLPAILTSLFCHSNNWRKWERRYYQTAMSIFIFFELITPTFITEYDTRPNRLFFEYLGSPAEVGGMLVRGFGSVVAFVLLGIVLAILILQKVIPTYRSNQLSYQKRIIGGFVCCLIGFAAIRGTVAHRPINPATVTFASDRMLNTLPLNSTYSLLYSAYRMKDEKNAGALYGSMPKAEMHKIVRQTSQLEGPPLDKDRPSLHFAQASKSYETPPHVVIILEESLGARYVGHLTGGTLTPELDALAKEGITLKNLYATGTRSVRGIEAVITGFLPTPARAVVKLGLSQSNFFTLANLFNSRGYTSKFIYGGEAHFDNMKGFLLNNGFQHIIDRSKFKDPVFTGTWGVSDEDMFSRLHQELEGATTPQFIFAFSVSNHSPWEFPKGRIGSEEANRESAVRYADWAIGDYFKKAKQSSYYKNTIFLLVADHDSRVNGASLIPIKYFHIPGLFLGKGVPRADDDRLVSQIDLAPTLVSLAGISDVHPMLGQDLSKPSDSRKERAIMQYGENFGYREEDRLVVFQPNLPPTQYSVQADDELIPSDIDDELKQKALAHVLWPSWAYRNRRYNPYH